MQPFIVVLFMQPFIVVLLWFLLKLYNKAAIHKHSGKSPYKKLTTFLSHVIIIVTHYRGEDVGYVAQKSLLHLVLQVIRN